MISLKLFSTENNSVSSLWELIRNKKNRTRSKMSKRFVSSISMCGRSWYYDGRAISSARVCSRKERWWSERDEKFEKSMRVGELWAVPHAKMLYFSVWWVVYSIFRTLITFLIAVWTLTCYFSVLGKARWLVMVHEITRKKTCWVTKLASMHFFGGSTACHAINISHTCVSVRRLQTVVEHCRLPTKALSRQVEIILETFKLFKRIPEDQVFWVCLKIKATKPVCAVDLYFLFCFSFYVDEFTKPTKNLCVVGYTKCFEMKN